MGVVSKIPDLRFAGFGGEWEEDEFGSVLTMRRGLTYSPSDVHADGVRVLRSSNVDEDRFGTRSDDVFVDREAVDIDYAVNGEILITAANGSTRLVGKHAVVTGISERSAVAGGFMLIGAADNPCFVNALMSASWYQRFIEANVAGGNGAIGNLKRDDLANQRVAIATPAEQAKIGEFFERLDSLIELQRRELEKLRQFKSAMLTKMFPQAGADVPELRFPGFEGAWQEKSLGDLGETFSGLSGKSKNDFGHGEARFVTYKNVFANALSSIKGTEPVEIDDSQFRVKRGDVFFTTSSEVPEEVGMSSVWQFDAENVYLNSFCFGWRPQSDLDSIFLAYLLRSSAVRRSFVFLAQGISRFNISKKKAMEISLRVPDYEEQLKLGAFFQRLDELIALRERKGRQLRQIKQSLLQKMFV